jgi:hypothetical protein
MHAKNFSSEFLDIFKNDFRPVGAYAPMSQSGIPHVWSLELLFRLVLLSYLSLNANVQVCLLDWATAYWIY